MVSTKPSERLRATQLGAAKNSTSKTSTSGRVS